MASGHFDGQEKEPKTLNGPRVGGKQPIFHSHSAKAHRGKHTRKHHGGKRPM